MGARVLPVWPHPLSGATRGRARLGWRGRQPSLDAVRISSKRMRQKKAPAGAGAGDALRRSVYTGYSKILPHSLTRRVPKLRIGGLHKKKAPTEAGAGA